jgi:hypothetical protein
LLVCKIRERGCEEEILQLYYRRLSFESYAIIIFSSTTASQYDACGSVSTTDGLIVRGEEGLKPERQKERAETEGLALPPFQLERNFGGEGNKG